jgi:plasmid stability protein
MYGSMETEMADQDTRMVLRTVYLTPEVDEKLRIGAFHAGRSKNELIRDAISRFLTGDDEPRQAQAKATATMAAKKKTAKQKTLGAKAAKAESAA